MMGAESAPREGLTPLAACTCSSAPPPLDETAQVGPASQAPIERRSGTMGLVDTVKGWLNNRTTKADEATQEVPDAGEAPPNVAEVDSEPASEQRGSTGA